MHQDIFTKSYYNASLYHLNLLLCLLFFPPLFWYPPRNADLQFITSRITPPMLALHACMPAQGAYVFSQNKIPNTRSERVLLGGKSTPQPPPPPLFPLSTKIKTRREVALSVYTPLVHRPQRGLLIVTCACSAPSQSPVSQMHAGRSSPPPPP